VKKLLVLTFILAVIPVPKLPQSPSYIARSLWRDVFFLSHYMAPPSPLPNVYIAQVAAGGNTGADCADALVYTYFNTSGNWSSSGPIGPSTNVHLCGTITGTNTSNVNILTTHGNGTSGNPITILFETGAIVQSPACPGGSGGSNACILAPNSYITINGGTNGTVQAMLNGDSGATNCLSGTCTIQLALTTGVAVTGTNDTVENLTVTHMCMHTFQDNDAGFYQGNCNGIYASNTNALMTQNTVDNASTAIAGGNSSQEFSYNTLTYCNRCIVVGTTTSVYTGDKFHNNDISQLYTWDDGTGNNYHHNGIMFEIVGSGGQFIAPQVYDNYFHGLWSNDNIYGFTHITSEVFLDTNGEPDSVPNAYIVRNIFELDVSNCVVSGAGTCPGGVGHPLNYPGDGFVNVGGCNAAGCSPPNQSLIANNTMIGPSGAGCWSGGDFSNNISIENNLCATTSGAILAWPSSLPFPGSGSGLIDYNLYPGVPTSNAFAEPTTTCPPASCGNPYANINSWTAWSSGSLLLDRHCTPTGNTPGTGNSCNPTLAAAALTSSYYLGTGSVAIGAAVNLTTAWCTTIPALCTGAPSTFGRGGANDGVALPSGTTAWDTGARPYAASGSPSTTFSPTNLSFGNQVQGTSSASQTVTLTNSGTANLVITTIAAANTDYSLSSSPSCLSGCTVSAAGTVVVTVTFTPSVLGADNGSISFTDNAAGSPQSVTLAGTGIAANNVVVINVAPCANQALSGTCTIGTTTGGTELIMDITFNDGSGACVVSSVTDNKSNTWVQVPNARATDATPNDASDIWHTDSPVFLVSTVTINTTPSTGCSAEEVFYEVAGVNALDNGTHANSQSTSTTPSGAPVTTTANNEFVNSILNYQGSVTGIFSGNIFTNDSTLQGNGWAHYIQSATGTRTAQWQSSATGTSASSTAAFKLGGSPVTTGPVAPTLGMPTVVPH